MKMYYVITSVPTSISFDKEDVVISLTKPPTSESIPPKLNKVSPIPAIPPKVPLTPAEIRSPTETVSFPVDFF